MRTPFPLTKKKNQVAIFFQVSFFSFSFLSLGTNWLASDSLGLRLTKNQPNEICFYRSFKSFPKRVMETSLNFFMRRLASTLSQNFAPRRILHKFRGSKSQEQLHYLTLPPLKRFPSQSPTLSPAYMFVTADVFCSKNLFVNQVFVTRCTIVFIKNPSTAVYFKLNLKSNLFRRSLFHCERNIYIYIVLDKK